MNKSVYMLWLQGFDRAPSIVKRCVQSWQYYNPSWTIVLLDTTNLKDYIDDLDNYIDLSQYTIERQEIANIVRCILLHRYGGVWADATVFCNQPLDEWLHKYIEQGFFAYAAPGKDRLLSNWFLYSDKENYIMERWRDAIVHFHVNNNSKPHPYFIHHYLFKDLYTQDTEFKECWDRVPKLSANGLGPHYIQEQGLFKPLTKQVKHAIDSKVTALYKLQHSPKGQIHTRNTILHYLFSTIPV